MEPSNSWAKRLFLVIIFVLVFPVLLLIGGTLEAIDDFHEIIYGRFQYSQTFPRTVERAIEDQLAAKGIALRWIIVVRDDAVPCATSEIGYNGTLITKNEFKEDFVACAGTTAQQITVIRSEETPIR